MNTEAPGSWPAGLSSSKSDSDFSLDTPSFDRAEEGGVICLVLLRVGERETPHGFIERGAVPEVSREHCWLRCLRVRPCKYGPAKPCVFHETGRVELFDVHRSLHVPELPYVVVTVSCSRPPEKRIRCGLHDLLPCHNAVTVMS